MENLAHTLLGLSLAKAGLERATPLGTTALVISSNLPDIDVLAQIGGGGTLTYLQHHRGMTHSLIGLPLLAAILAVWLAYLDRKIRLRRDPFLRPARTVRLFWLSLVGGLGHTLMDYTNTYGVRPFLPFSDRWFYGDLVFVVDPWIWLILGSAVVWLSASGRARALFWLLVGAGASLVMALALDEPTPEFPLTVPTAARVIWFTGAAVIFIGAVLQWRRAGEALARIALLVLAAYYGGMWVARQEAKSQARESLPVASATSLVAWPTPANPLLWQPVISAPDSVYTRYLNIASSPGQWREVATLDARFLAALRQSEQARVFLKFARYPEARVEEGEGGYTVTLRDLRFNLQMRATLDRDLALQSTVARWY